MFEIMPPRRSSPPPEDASSHMLRLGRDWITPEALKRMVPQAADADLAALARQVSGVVDEALMLARDDAAPAAIPRRALLDYFERVAKAADRLVATLAASPELHAEERTKGSELSRAYVAAPRLSEWLDAAHIAGLARGIEPLALGRQPNWARIANLLAFLCRQAAERQAPRLASTRAVWRGRRLFSSRLRALFTAKWPRRKTHAASFPSQVFEAIRAKICAELPDGAALAALIQPAKDVRNQKVRRASAPKGGSATPHSHRNGLRKQRAQGVKG